jgi:hypothetical protein
MIMKNDIQLKVHEAIMTPPGIAMRRKVTLPTQLERNSHDVNKHDTQQAAVSNV